MAERLAERLPTLGGTFLQMEDEIASIAAVIGAAWGGQKAVTATSGPRHQPDAGEHRLRDRHRDPPVSSSTSCGAVRQPGSPRSSCRGMSSSHGAAPHGDYQTIALAPSSVQECFDYTVEAFNLSERFPDPRLRPLRRLPRPHAGRTDDSRPGGYRPRGPQALPPAGRPWRACRASWTWTWPPCRSSAGGHKAHVTSSCHDAYGRRNVIDASALHIFIKGLNDKIEKHRDEIVKVEADADGAEVVLVSYGSIFRCAQAAVEAGARRGASAGLVQDGDPLAVPGQGDRRAGRPGKTSAGPGEQPRPDVPLRPGGGSRQGHGETSCRPRVLGEMHEIEDVLKAVREVRA